MPQEVWWQLSPAGSYVTFAYHTKCMKTKTIMKVISLLLLICSKTHPSWMLYGCRSMNVSPMNGGDVSSDAAQAGDGSGGRVPDFDDMAVLSDLAVPFVVQWSADESHRLQLDVALAGVAAIEAKKLLRSLRSCCRLKLSKLSKLRSLRSCCRLKLSKLSLATEISTKVFDFRQQRDSWRW